LLATCVPDPEMPENEKGLQLGIQPSTYGRLLPGYAATIKADGLEIRMLTPKNEGPILLAGITLDERGFLMPRPSTEKSPTA